MQEIRCPFVACDLNMKVGIARNVREGARPIHGVRIVPDAAISGWFFWGGEEAPSDDPDFYLPLHGVHLYEWAPLVLPYLGLAPGWRFIVTEEYEDVYHGAGLD
ncbi:immunity protein Imm33 domain-containing protein [Pseudoduganella armeniaca]|uniref:Imm33-like domain-containing protein n=1 Tax=Pseudoduganella armeniaca TaxID=2072590 RepID=A0A2R4CBV2_9BURK|nr:hypothetical protein C9I28_16350 [Pseudoduganella armeniaca]